MSKYPALIKCQISDNAVQFHKAREFKNANYDIWNGSHHVYKNVTSMILWLQYRELLIFGKQALFFPKFGLHLPQEKPNVLPLYLILVKPNVMP